MLRAVQVVSAQKEFQKKNRREMKIVNRYSSKYSRIGGQGLPYLMGPAEA
jgi:hypothetical protein